MNPLKSRLKRAMYACLGQLTKNASGPPGLPLDTSRLKSILVIRPDRLGDVILSTPVYESIKRSCPGASLTVLAARGNAQLLKNNPYIDRILPFDKKNPIPLIGELVRHRFDLAITLNKKFSSTAALMAIASGARWRANFFSDPGQSIYNLLVPPGSDDHHETQNNLNVLRHLGFTEICERPQLYFSQHETGKIDTLINERRKHPDRPLVLIKPGTRIPAWGWDLAKFQQTSDRLLEEQLAEVFILCAPGEESLVNPWFRNRPVEPVIVPPVTANELALLIRKSDALLCNHTGIMHMASAVQTPVVAIFKHGQIDRWGPCHTRFVVLEERGEDDLSVDTVIDALTGLMNSPQPG